MLTEERLDAIRQLLSQHGKVLANDLAAQFGVSDDTIRRDLRELARLGHCRRVYGGALLPAPDTGTLAVRTSDQADVKARLARATAALVRDGQTLYIDASSTNLAIAKALSKDLRLTVVTNAPAIAMALSDNPKHTVVVLGAYTINPRAPTSAPRPFAKRETSLPTCSSSARAASTRRSASPRSMRVRPRSSAS